MTQEEVIIKLKEIKPVLAHNYGVTVLALFGSYSRNEQTPESDIDIMVEHETPLGFRFLDMINDLDKALAKEVQVISRKGIKPKYFEAIKGDLIYV